MNQYLPTGDERLKDFNLLHKFLTVRHNLSCFIHSTQINIDMCSTGDVQFSAGEQDDQIRKKFWKTDYKICPKCRSKNIAVHYWSCGCRFNGDGWGTVVYQCVGNERVEDVEKLEWDKQTRKLPGEHGCGFYTSFRYDEAGSGPDNYETTHWGKPSSSS